MALSLSVSCLAQKQTAALNQIVTKQSIGLGNVDNTSDTNKPVSVAQKAYVDAVVNTKYEKTGGVLSGDVFVQKQDPMITLQNSVLGSNFYLYGGNVAKYSIDKIGHWFDIQGVYTVQFNKDISYFNNPVQASGYANPKISTISSGGNIVMKMQSVDNFLGYVGTESNHSLGIITNNSIKMLVQADGKVGIGVNEPLEKLHLRWGHILLEGDNVSYKAKNNVGNTFNLATLGNNNVFAIANNLLKLDPQWGSTALSVNGGLVASNVPIYINNSANNFIVKTANGNCRKLVIADDGMITAPLVACP
jgi:hypothetical protein